MRRSRCRGQGAVELLAAVPLLVVAALLVWQMGAVAWAALEAQRDVRERALRAAGPAATDRRVTAAVPVPAVIPGMHGLVARSGASVRTPGE